MGQTSLLHVVTASIQADLVARSQLPDSTRVEVLGLVDEERMDCFFDIIKGFKMYPSKFGF